MRRCKEDAQITRQSVLDAAMDVFCQRGVARATLEEIARRAAVTRGAVYWHFRNKEELFDALCQRHFVHVQSLMEDTGQPCPPEEVWPKLLQGCVRLLQDVAQNPESRKLHTILALQCEHVEDNQAISGLLQRYRDMGRTRVDGALRTACAQGLMPADLHVQRATTLFLAAFSGIIAAWLHAPESFRLCDEAQHMMHGCADMLRTSAHLRIR